MKHSNIIGAFASVALIVCCFLPWVYIASINTTITGFLTPHTNFGTPGIIHVLCAAIGVLLFLLNRVWAKRLNVFLCAVNVAWSVRNFILISRCELGECPQKKIGIYAIVILSILMLIMSLLPKLELKENQ